MKEEKQRRLVIITGYYGFDNLGDEAILEELLHEVTAISNRNNIVVLSNNPMKTSALYGVKSVNRWNLFDYISLLKGGKLLISGGGGLFQDRTGPRSVIFYALQIILAKLSGVKVFIYAQGLGPLKGLLTRLLTRLAFKQADLITVRDNNSIALLNSWGLAGQLSADPVWKLPGSPLPGRAKTIINRLKGDLPKDGKIIGVSLRLDSALKDYHLKCLAESIVSISAQGLILLLPLQKSQDLPALKALDVHLQKLEVKSYLFDTSILEKPSQWLSLIQSLDLIISMRFHALLMAIKEGCSVIGIAYDPKVSFLLSEFGKPSLSLNELNEEVTNTKWSGTLKSAYHAESSGHSQAKLVATQLLANNNIIQLESILKG